HYEEMSGLNIVMRKKDVDDIFDPIHSLCRRYWMPEEVKEAALFFEVIVLLEKVEAKEINSYAKLMLNTKEVKDDEWHTVVTMAAFGNMAIIPEELLNDETIIVNDYISHKNFLIKTIKNWLSAKSSIELDLRMKEIDGQIPKK